MRAPPELDELQKFLSDALRLRGPIADDGAKERETRAFLAGNDRLTPAAQADIYREQFWARHIGSLVEDYPGLSALIGSEAFDAFLTAYLMDCPPRHPSLRDLGDRIVGFAEGYGDFPEGTRAAAIEMVRYENAIVDVFDGAEPPPLDAAKLTAMDEEAWDRARVVLNPLLVRMKLEYPVHTYRIAVKTALESPAEDGGETACCDGPAHRELPPFPAPRPVWLALFRPVLVVSYEELEPEAYALLDALAAGESLPRACDIVAEDLDEESANALMAKVGPWFQQWTTWRWIVDVV